MFKKIGLFFLTTQLIGLSIGCDSAPKSPVFLDLKDVKVETAALSQVVLSGQALFHNPNVIGGTLTKTNIHIKVNEVAITDIVQHAVKDIPSKSDFMVPVQFSFNPNQLLSENEGFLKNALKSFVNKELKINYNGTATVEVLKIPFDIPIEHTETLSLGLNRTEAP